MRHPFNRHSCGTRSSPLPQLCRTPVALALLILLGAPTAVMAADAGCVFADGSPNPGAGTDQGAENGGQDNTTCSPDAIAFGKQNYAGGGSASSAVGYKNTVRNGGSSAFGAENMITQFNSNAFGRLNVVSGSNSSAFGTSNQVSASQSIGIGFDNRAIYLASTAIGQKTLPRRATATPSATATRRMERTAARSDLKTRLSAPRVRPSAT